MSPSRESRPTIEFATRSGALGEVVGDARLKDRFPKVLQSVAGVSLKTSSSGQSVECAAVLLAFDTLTVTYEVTTTTVLSDKSLSEAASASVAAAFRSFPTLPDLLLVEGHGVSGTGRMGLAVCIGVNLNLPTIGVATEIDLGTSKPLHEMRGAFSPLRDAGVQIGWMLRSKVNDAPLVVSPGHHVSMAAAPELVMAMVQHNRMPEPIRLASMLLKHV